jgi:hypothetical protein
MTIEDGVSVVSVVVEGWCYVGVAYSCCGIA